MTSTIIESQYPYKYVDDDGYEVAFREGDRFILLDKSSEDWWKVQRTGLFTGKPICYIPAAYVKELNITQKENQTQSPYMNLHAYKKLLENETKAGNSVGNGAAHEYMNLAVYQNLLKEKHEVGDNNNEPLNDLGEDIENDDAFIDESLDEIPDDISELKLNESSDMSLPQSPSCGSLSFEISPRTDNLKSFTLPAGWKKCQNDEGRSYYYNERRKEAAWKPPRQTLANAPTNVPEGWEVTNTDNETIYVNKLSKEKFGEERKHKWKTCVDGENQMYYYNLDGVGTAWELPQVEETDKRMVRRKSLDDTLEGMIRRQTMGSMSSRSAKCQSVFVRSHSSLSSNDEANRSLSPGRGRKTMSPDISHRRSRSNHSFELPNIDEIDNIKNMHKADKEGSLFRRKVYEGKKAIKKALWQPVYCCKYGSSLVFYKDQKNSASKAGLSAGKPDSSLDLHGALLDHVTKDKAKGKKNVFQITSYGRLTVQQFVADNQIDMAEWITCIQTTIKYLEEKEPLPPFTEDLAENSAPPKSVPLPPAISPGDVCAHPTVATMPRHLVEKGGFKGFSRKLSKKVTSSTTSLNMESDDKGEKMKIKKKLRKYLPGRPSFHELEAQGIIKDYYFGCAIAKICDREDNLVPKLVVQLTAEVERRGLDVDGIYRVSGNLSMIQKLRVMVDHGEEIDYKQQIWTDIHLLAGALKLFFRELPEPLFPFAMYEKFISAIKSPFKGEKIKLIKEYVKELPRNNAETLELLMLHLKKVIAHSQKNRMQAQNLGIVFGPTLLWPEKDNFNMAMTTVYQSQVVEFMLVEFNSIFVEYL